MIIVTGGAGCIGSAIIWALNKRGITDIILVDGVDNPEKKKNIASLSYFALEDKGNIPRPYFKPQYSMVSRCDYSHGRMFFNY